MEVDIGPFPRQAKVDEAKIELGSLLYHDTRLFEGAISSCASCHDLKKGGTSRTATILGSHGQKGAVNPPTTYNSAHNIALGWDGRAKDVKAWLRRFSGPIMEGQWDHTLKKLQTDETYQAAFMKAYNTDTITEENLVDAIAAFKASLMTPDSRFDDYLRGNEKALTKLEEKGLELFMEKGCMSCHNGTYLGGNSYQMVSQQYFEDRGKITEADYGRFNVTGEEDDRYMFKVPMLRNVAVTAPYFHDGTHHTLESAVHAMAKYQLGEDLNADETKAIVAFLKTLTGKYQGKYLDQM